MPKSRCRNPQRICYPRKDGKCRTGMVTLSVTALVVRRCAVVLLYRQVTLQCRRLRVRLGKCKACLLYGVRALILGVMDWRRGLVRCAESGCESASRREMCTREGEGQERRSKWRHFTPGGGGWWLVGGAGVGGVVVPGD
jgi:hypothetical protein